MNEQSFVKTRRAEEIRDEIWKRLHRHIVEPSDHDELVIGSLIGDLANNLRSALNYTMRLFITEKLRKVATQQEYRKIKKKRSYDFPWADVEKEFKGKPQVDLTSRYFPEVYELVKAQQPFRNQQWLRLIMRVSNDDKHVHINLVESPTVVGGVVVTKDGKPWQLPKICGDYMIVRHYDRAPQFIPLPDLPRYFKNLRLFATNTGWRQFFIEVDGLRFEPFLIINHTTKKTELLISEFEKLAGM